MITIAIAEDHQSIIDGICLLLQYEENIRIVGTVNDGQALLDLVRKKQPQIVITDIRMPKLNGIEVTKTITSAFPHVKVIAFSMFDQDEAVQQMHNAGASGYLFKNSPLEHILKAIETVSNGDHFYDDGIDVGILDTAFAKAPVEKKQLLSKSERAILQLIAQNKTSSEIAEIRFTAVSTVEKHRKNMMRKLGLSGKGELLKYAIESQYSF